MHRLPAALLLTLAASSLQALRVEIHPAGPLSIYRANADHGYVDLVLHNVLVVNDSPHAVDLGDVTVEVLEGTAVIESRTILPAEIGKTTKEIAAKGQLATAQLDTDFPWADLKSRKLVLGAGTHLLPHQAAAIKNIYLTVHGEPSRVRVRAAAAKGVTAMATIPITRQAPARYSSPLQGVWYLRSIPNVTSHHRWNSQTEFAVDFFKLGENGLPWRTDGRSAADYYAFGTPVLAAADGVVAAAENGATQDYEIRLQKPGESDQAFDERLTRYNLEMMKKDPYKAMIGNYVVIRHANGEYSSYAHLKAGSVTLQKGDRVTRGQPIGAIGDTGDTNIVHLHFGISDGPDPLTWHSLPFDFNDLRPTGGDLGRVVRSVPRPAQ
jgi:murein DD-endopeptidase MepM/ murein hydrolase activator NlpD